VITSDIDSARPSTRRTPLEEEQSLCNEALLTDNFDEMSDKEWIALCERRGDKGRVTAQGEESKAHV
jgi:hypothetical protein